MSYHEGNQYACAREECGHVICLTPQMEGRFRRTHESFKCPAGHSQSFQQETEQEKEIRLLKERLEHSRWLEGVRSEELDVALAECRSLRSKLAWARRKQRLLTGTAA